METDQLREDNTADAACTPRQTEMMSGKSRISLPRLSRMTSIHEISHCIPPFQGMSHTKVGQYPDDLKDIWEELAIRVHTLFPLSNQEPKGVRFDGWALSPIFVDTHTQPTRSYRYSQAVNTTSALTNVMATSISSSPACSFKNNSVGGSLFFQILGLVCTSLYVFVTQLPHGNLWLTSCSPPCSPPCSPCCPHC
jgi:hypothetical protein